MNFKQENEFTVNSSSLKDIRSFARDLFEKVEELNDYKEELVLALAEAAQNIVKHAYKNQPTDDLLKVVINYNDKTLMMELFDKGNAVIPENIKPRNLEDIKAGGLGTFFIGQIMDEVIFKTSKIDWVNHLILVKKF
jgi:serine/threonine-protein kinase RsbW|tara:strand:- start:928 stop:1338 length:411 start_codon:yes stop_codon:yes gene_type:complete